MFVFDNSGSVLAYVHLDLTVKRSKSGAPDFPVWSGESNFPIETAAKMLMQRLVCLALVILGRVVVADCFTAAEGGGDGGGGGRPHRILLDTDVDTDDLFALLYLLKLNRSEFDLQVRTYVPIISCSSTV